MFLKALKNGWRNSFHIIWLVKKLNVSRKTCLPPTYNFCLFEKSSVVTPKSTKWIWYWTWDCQGHTKDGSVSMIHLEFHPGPTGELFYGIYPPTSASTPSSPFPKHRRDIKNNIFLWNTMLPTGSLEVKESWFRSHVG